MDSHINKSSGAIRVPANIHKTLPKLPKAIHDERKALKFSPQAVTTVLTPSNPPVGFTGGQSLELSIRPSGLAHISSPQQDELAVEQNEDDLHFALIGTDNSVLTEEEEASSLFSFSGMPTEETIQPSGSILKNGSKKRAPRFLMAHKSSRRMNRERSKKSRTSQMSSPMKMFAKSTKNTMDYFKAGPEYGQGYRLVTRGKIESHRAFDRGAQGCINTEPNRSNSVQCNLRSILDDGSPVSTNFPLTSRDQSCASVPTFDGPTGSQQCLDLDGRNPIPSPIESHQFQLQPTHEQTQEKVNRSMVATEVVARERAQARTEHEEEDKIQMGTLSRTKIALKSMMQAFHFKKNKNKETKRLRISAPILQENSTGDRLTTYEELSGLINQPDEVDKIMPVNKDKALVSAKNKIQEQETPGQEIREQESKEEKEEANEIQSEESFPNNALKETLKKCREPLFIPPKHIRNGFGSARVSQLAEVQDLSFTGSLTLTSSPIAESTPSRVRYGESSTRPPMPTRAPPSLPLIDHKSSPVTMAKATKNAMSFGPQQMKEDDDVEDEDEDEDDGWFEICVATTRLCPTAQQLRELAAGLQPVPRLVEIGPGRVYNGMRARESSLGTPSPNAAVHRRYEIFGAPLMVSDENKTNDSEDK